MILRNSGCIKRSYLFSADISADMSLKYLPCFEHAVFLVWIHLDFCPQSTELSSWPFWSACHYVVTHSGHQAQVWVHCGSPKVQGSMNVIFFMFHNCWLIVLMLDAATNHQVLFQCPSHILEF